MTTKPKLKPCPFCGSAVSIAKWPYGYYISHARKCSIITATRDYRAQFYAIKAWNTRARRKKQRKGKSTKQPRRIK